MLIDVDFTSISNKPALPHQKISNGFDRQHHSILFSRSEVIKDRDRVSNRGLEIFAHINKG
jgi:hypothetical protein